MAEVAPLFYELRQLEPFALHNQLQHSHLSLKKVGQWQRVAPLFDEGRQLKPLLDAISFN
eukprot:11268068-Karenia_brevis.AAC.1